MFQCSLPVRVASSSAARPLQVRRRSPRGADPGSGAQANQTPPHYFHRGAAGRAGGALPAESVSRCKHEGEAGTAHTLEGGKSRGKTRGAQQVLVFFHCRVTVTQWTKHSSLNIPS